MHCIGPWDSINVDPPSHGNVAVDHRCSITIPWVCCIGPWDNTGVQSVSHGTEQMFNVCPMGRFHWSWDSQMSHLSVPWVNCIGAWDRTNDQSLSHGYIIFVCGLSHGHVTLVNGTIQMFTLCPMGMFHWSMGQQKCTPFVLWGSSIGTWDCTNVPSMSHGLGALVQRLSHGHVPFVTWTIPWASNIGSWDSTMWKSCPMALLHWCFGRPMSQLYQSLGYPMSFLNWPIGHPMGRLY